MCLGRNRRIKELEKKVNRLEAQLLGRTTLTMKYDWPITWRSFSSVKRLSLADAVKAITEHLNIRFKFIAGEQKSDRWEIVEKVEESEEE